MLGVIADDVTGACDVALALRESGLRTVLHFGVPGQDAVPPGECEAVVVTLKSRMALPARAVEESLLALELLRRHGARQIYFKVCSTFDSPPEGSIGPVLNALADALDAPAVLVTPSSPQHGRTQHQGQLFVNGVPLAESPLRHHPVTPMTDSSLPRLLRAQTDRAIGLVCWDTVRTGPRSVRTALTDAAQRGVRYLLADALDEDDDPLEAWPAAVLCGSCSARTLEQLAVLRDRDRPLHRLDTLVEPDPVALAERALDWYDGLPPGAPQGAPVPHSSVPPGELRAVQRALGAERAAAVLEEATGRIAAGLVARGVRRLVAVGGETSGAVIAALGVTGAWWRTLGEIGPKLGLVGVTMVSAFAASEVLGRLGLGEQLAPYIEDLQGVPPVVAALVVGLVLVIVAGPLNTTSALAAVGPVAFAALTAAGVPAHVAFASVIVWASSEGCSPPGAAPLYVAAGIADINPARIFLPVALYYLLPTYLFGVLIAVGALWTPG